MIDMLWWIRVPMSRAAFTLLNREYHSVWSNSYETPAEQAALRLTERGSFRKALRDGPLFEIEREADAKTYYFFAMSTTTKLPEAALCEIRNHQHQTRKVTNERVPSVMRMRKGSAQDQWAGINDKVDGKKYINEMDVSTLVTVSSRVRSAAQVAHHAEH